MDQHPVIQTVARRVSDLTANPRNARKHPKKQLAQIEASIREFGFVNPVLIDGNNVLIAGHGRLAAARNIGMETVPAICLRHLNEVQKRALALADNKIALNASWDQALLAQELTFLSQVDIDCDVTITGFETAEIDLIIGTPARDASDEEESLELPEVGSPTVRRGDRWLLGDHRLFCGDATNSEDLDLLMAGELAQMVFTDPPYNVAIDGNVSGLGRTRHREFVMASGEMNRQQFVSFLWGACRNLAAHSADGSIHFICMDWRHARELQEAAEGIYAEQKNLCVWNKTNGGMGAFYRSKHELVLVFKNGTAAHINNFGLGQKGRYRTNVWDYPGVNTFRRGRMEELDSHPTVKPVGMVADAIMDCSHRGGIVLDIFLGSGTTILAAERTGRRGYGMELDPVYAETTILRWQEATGQTAIHEETGLDLSGLARVRRAPPDIPAEPGGME